MKKVLTAGAALVVLQALLFGGYLMIKKARDGSGDKLTVQRPERISTPLPKLVLRYENGSTDDLADHRGRPLLLHFWATWCPPCRDELPGLLALAEREKTTVLLVGLDEDWEVVRRFLDGPVPSYVALADGSQVAARFGVHELPESFVVDRTGNMTLRFRGAQDWTAEPTLRFLPQEMR